VVEDVGVVGVMFNCKLEVTGGLIAFSCEVVNKGNEGKL
jgi:hypothetical protein